MELHLDPQLAMGCHLPVMKHLLLTTIAAVVLVGCGNPEADRALLDAAYEGNIEVVKQQLAAGADVNAKDDEGMTPLHNASTWGHKEIVELLITEGADVNAMDDDGNTPMHFAIFNGNPATAALLYKHGGKMGEELKAEGK